MNKLHATIVLSGVVHHLETIFWKYKKVFSNFFRQVFQFFTKLDRKNLGEKLWAWFRKYSAPLEKRTSCQPRYEMPLFIFFPLKFIFLLNLVTPLKKNPTLIIEFFKNYAFNVLLLFKILLKVSFKLSKWMIFLKFFFISAIKKFSCESADYYVRISIFNKLFEFAVLIFKLADEKESVMKIDSISLFCCLRYMLDDFETMFFIMLGCCDVSLFFWSTWTETIEHEAEYKYRVEADFYCFP